MLLTKHTRNVSAARDNKTYHSTCKATGTNGRVRVQRGPWRKIGHASRQYEPASPTQRTDQRAPWCRACPLLSASFQSSVCWEENLFQRLWGAEKGQKIIRRRFSLSMLRGASLKRLEGKVELFIQCGKERRGGKTILNNK